MTSGWQLPRGATGFSSLKFDPLPETDLRAFGTFSYEVARRSGGRVLNITPRIVTPNFHTAVILRREVKVAVLGHAHLPLYAIAEVPVIGSCSPIFTELVALQEAATSVGMFRLLTLEQLETPVSRADLSGLDSVELREIAYWQPDTVGELLFNYWD